MSVSNKSKESYAKWYEKNKTEIRKQKTLIMRRLRKENPEKYRGHSRAAKKRLKDKVFSVYGMVCIACGFSDVRALTLDHKKNNGAEERKEIGERGVYLRSLQKEFHSEYQTLCMNCQFIKRVESKRQNQHGYSSSG
jgi:hypothetical protein